MCEQMEFWINSIQELAPHAKACQITQAAGCLSQRTGVSEENILSCLYQDLLCGIPFRQTAVGKVICC